MNNARGIVYLLVGESVENQLGATPAPGGQCRMPVEDGNRNRSGFCGNRRVINGTIRDLAYYCPAFFSLEISMTSDSSVP